MDRLPDDGLDELERLAGTNEPGRGQGLRRAPRILLVADPGQSGGLAQA